MLSDLGGVYIRVGYIKRCRLRIDQWQKIGWRCGSVENEWLGIVCPDIPNAKVQLLIRSGNAMQFV